MAALARNAVRLTPVGWMRSLERRVVLAGEPARWPMQRVLAAKFVLGAAGLAAGFFYFSGHRSLVGLLIGIGVTALGFFVPDLLLYNQAQKRQMAIQDELADTIDQITVSVEAGLGFEAALSRAARTGTGPLAEELTRTLQEMQVGVPRDQALRNLVDRTNVADLRHFVFALLQAQKHGVSVSQVLRVQTAELRVKRRQRAEEKAMKIPVKILFPLVTCIFPVIFIVLLGPAAIQIMRNLFWGALNMTTHTTTLDLPLNDNCGVPKNLVSLLDDLDSDRRRGTAERPRFATGFDPMDRVLDGGLRPGDLTLIGGLPGVGKTITALQWARSFALAGHPVVYACYEHEERELLGRLLALEIAEEGGDEDARFKFRRVLREVLAGRAWLEQEVMYEPRLRPAYERLSSYADRLWVIKASGSTTGVSELARHVEESGDGAQVLVVDYLQKVAAGPDLANDGDRVTRVAEGLKELALHGDIAVLAIAAADREGLGSPRMRLHHLRGSTSLAYEADLAILLNDKHRIVSKMHLTYDAVRAEDFHNTVVFSLEKYRAGQANLDLEFRKEFASYRFNPAGGHVFDRLIDGRLDPD